MAEINFQTLANIFATLGMSRFIFAPKFNSLIQYNTIFHGNPLDLLVDCNPCNGQMYDLK